MIRVSSYNKQQLQRERSSRRVFILNVLVYQVLYIVTRGTPKGWYSYREGFAAEHSKKTVANLFAFVDLMKLGKMLKMNSGGGRSIGFSQLQGVPIFRRGENGGLETRVNMFIARLLWLIAEAPPQDCFLRMAVSSLARSSLM